MVVVEVEVCGMFVVVSNVGGFMELSKFNVISLVVEKGFVEDLVEKIDVLVKDKELRIMMGKVVRKFVEDNYSLEDNFNDVDKIYRSILNKVYFNK